MLSHNPKRDRLQIFAEILNLCKKPQGKTRVMHRTNLSYTLLKDCLLQLQKKGFIEVHHSKEKYTTTERGYEFLDKWTALQRLMITKKPLQVALPFSSVQNNWVKFSAKYFG